MRSAIPSEEESQPLGPILIKLLGFSIAMVVLPIGSYFLSRDYYFGEKNTTPPAILAASVANIILATFIYLAIRADLSEVREPKEKIDKVVVTGAGEDKVEKIEKKSGKKADKKTE